MSAVLMGGLRADDIHEHLFTDSIQREVKPWNVSYDAAMANA